MDAERLKLLGSTMFGTQWQSELARQIGKSARVVRFWAAGHRAIPDADAERIETLARDHAARVSAVAQS